MSEKDPGWKDLKIKTAEKMLCESKVFRSEESSQNFL